MTGSRAQNFQIGIDKCSSIHRLPSSCSLCSSTFVSVDGKHRSVVILRDVEELTTAEAASTLEITEDVIKVRLHRAHTLVRRALYRQSGQCARDLFTFPATRCDRVVAAVLGRI